MAEESAALGAFLAPLRPQLHVVHLAKQQQDGAAARLESAMAAAKASGWTEATGRELVGDDWVALVDDYVADVMADLICIVPRPHSLWEDLFGKRLIAQLAFEAIVPLLSLPSAAS